MLADPLKWPALDCVRLAAAEHFGCNVDELDGSTRVDELGAGDELKVIDFIARVETSCRCDIPDYEITATATLAQLASLVEKHRVKEG